MNRAYTHASEALADLCSMVMMYGTDTPSRNGLTKELVMNQITLTNPVRRPEVTTPGRNVSLPAQIAETMWLLAGRNDVEWLSRYLPRAKDFSDDGKEWRGGYGPRIRGWASNEEWGGLDQLAYVVKLLKEDPGTRRAVIAIYDPQIDMQPGKDIPCNDFLHFLPRDGVLELHVFTRSNDLMWGWSGINSFEWTKLLEIVAALVGMKPGALTFSISSLHLYESPFEKARTLARQGSRGFAFQVENPAFAPEVAQAASVDGLDGLVRLWFATEAVIRQDPAGATASIETFPEPMMRSWLYVLQAWTTGDHSNVDRLYHGTSLQQALFTSPKRKFELDNQARAYSIRKEFLCFLTDLHKEKNEAYGDSWMKRGEQMSIMANIARKVDRLGVEGGGDTAADTVMDLLIYLVKYNLWLQREAAAKDRLSGEEHVKMVNESLSWLGPDGQKVSVEDRIAGIKADFEVLEGLVIDQDGGRQQFVWTMARETYPLALALWHKERNQVRFFNGYEPKDEQ